MERNAQIKEKEIFFDEYAREFWSTIVFKAIDLALKINQNPLISRREALQIIPRRSLDRGVETGELKKLRHGKGVQFSRIEFHKYILSNPKLKVNGRENLPAL